MSFPVFLAAINFTGSAEGALVPVLLRITHWPKSGLPVSPPGLFPPWDPVCGTRQQTRQRHLWTKQLLPSKIVVHFHAVGLGVIHAHIPMLRLRSTLLGDISLSTPNTPVQVTTWYTSSNVVPSTRFTSERQDDAWEIDSESTYVQHDKATPIFR